MNLADDAQLLDMMKAANFFCIFMGIESPDTETLISTQKKQNTKRNLAESVHKIYAAGMFVIAGFIVGFDAENGHVADAMIDCIETTSIPVCMVGLLTALPNTQLARRLEKEKRLLPVQSGRYDQADQCTGGLNFVTLRPRRNILADYKAVLEAVYAPEAYFARVRAVGRALRHPQHPGKFSLKELLQDLGVLMRLTWHATVKEPHLRRHFWRTMVDTARHNPSALEFVVNLIAMYLHLGPFATHVIKELDNQIFVIDEEASKKPTSATLVRC